MRHARVRITAKVEEVPPGPLGIKCRRITDWSDLHVEALDEDGNAHELTCLRVEFTSIPGEELVAKITVPVDELDAELLAALVDPEDIDLAAARKRISELETEVLRLMIGDPPASLDGQSRT